MAARAHYLRAHLQALKTDVQSLQPGICQVRLGPVRSAGLSKLPPHTVDPVLYRDLTQTSPVQGGDRRAHNSCNLVLLIRAEQLCMLARCASSGH